MIMVSRGPINAEELASRLDTKGAGSVVMHLGVCKPDPEGKKSSGVTFVVQGDPEAELEGIEESIRQEYNAIDVVLAKRTGKVEVGEIILYAAVAAKDRENSFAACREAVEQCKKMSSLKKTEHFISSE